MSSNNIEDIYPLAPTQQGILFHTLYAESPETYVVQIEWTLRGAFDAEAWKRSWQEVLDRHPALRTAFAWEKLAEPVQIVWKRLKLAFDEHDLRALPRDERLARARALADAERRRGFDPTRAPLMRFSLMRLADDATRFVWSHHHLLLDGWSTQIVIKEVFAIYAGLTGGVAPRLERVRPFGEYVRWRKRLDAAAEAAFWRKELGGFSAPTPLGVERAGAAAVAGVDPSFGHERRALPEPIAAAVTAFAREHGLTVGTVVQGAWALLLSRYSREDDVLFGATVSGRSAPIQGVEGMVGLFINTLPVRVSVDASVSAVEFLRALQAHAAELREHEHGVLAEVQRGSDVPHGSPLFESLVVIENFPLASPSTGGAGGGGGRAALSIADGLALERPAYPLTLKAIFQRTLDLELGYDARRFDAGTVGRALEHLGNLIQGLVAAPERAVGALPLVGDAERQALVEAAGRRVDYPVRACVHQRFEAQADRTPDAVAVTSEGRSLTYRALDAQANQLAHRLRALGVGRGDLVGLATSRSLGLLVGILGILKAGGAYLPLDPDYPRDRLAFMLSDAAVGVVVTERAYADLVLEGAAAVVLDDPAIDLSREPAGRPEPTATPDDLAYVIYTSGSTGRPKGTLVTHANVVRLFDATDAWFGFGPDDVWTMFHSYAFDFSVWEIWGALFYGGRVVVVPYWVSRAPDTFYQLLLDEGVTVLSQTPSAFRQLMRADQEATAERATGLRLRYVVFGGEALNIGELRPWWDRHGDERPRLVNMYGITETTVHVTYRPVSRADLERPASSVIGCPIPDLTVHVLDARREPLPLGVAGEMYVGGAGVARGYLDRPELTAARFLPDPFSEQPGARLYRTGDLARRLEGGELEYLGRIDHQVKIRGFRIELGEIEAALAEHPTVREAVVLVREDAADDKRIVAYVVGADISTSDLRHALGDRLPAYMVPSAIVVLDALPLTANGKLDRRALPAPTLDGGGERAYVAPRGPVEAAVAGVFADTLQIPVDRVGAHDGFFDLGGHSLLATQVVTRLRTAFGIDLPVRAIFEASTPAELALRVASGLAGTARREAPPILPAPRVARMPLSFGQERLWFLHQLDSESPAYLVPLALRLSGALDVTALERALGEIVRRHEVLRTTFDDLDGRPAQVVHPAAPVPLPTTSLADLPPGERERATRAEAESEARRPLDLTRGPVLRARLLELASDDHVLLLTLHHVVSDAWSSGLLNRELTALYGAFSRGEPSPLPELPVQYVDYAAWQRGWLSGEVLDEHLAYWKTQLAGAPHVLELPADRARPPVQSFRGAHKSFVVPAAVASGLKDLARREGVTLYMTLLAAFDVLLYRWTGQDDFLVGTPIAGRTRAETEALIGFFLNTSVMRARVSSELTFKALLAQVKETALGAYAHQDMPFERLVQELSPEPDPSRSPLFQVIFNLQNAPREGLRLEGLKLRAAVAESHTVKVDLTLIMGETPAGLVGRLEYSTDLFDAATIDRLHLHFETLLAAVVKQPQRRVRELSLLPEDERRRLLVEWNETAGAHDLSTCFHELFEAQADAAPDAPALVAGEARLTYRELEARANRLAHHLRALGVGPDAVVGLCCERDAELIVSILGIHKAGGAYVPLDPAHPARRLAQILSDAGASVLVAHAAYAELVQAGLAAFHGGAPPPLAVVRPDADAEVIAARSDARPALEATSANLAYVLFTSGSTGVPKGVAVEHRNVVNYLHGIGPRLELPPGASYAHVSTVSADLGNTSIFPPLATGGTVHLVPLELTTDPDGLGAYMAREGIDLLKIAPSHLSTLLAASSQPERLLPRRIVVLGGEGLTWELVARIEELGPQCRILNHYGPTETTIGCLTCAVPRGHRVPGTAIAPLGRPIPNMRVYVVAPDMTPTPTGVPGEACYAGAGIARGYLGRPDLTAERFVADPFSDAPGARLYRSGDRVRYLPSGEVSFLGRIDFQVKVRGFRIELGEIEAALLAHDGIREAVVLAVEDDSGGRTLAAFVVPRGEEAPSRADLAAFLAQRVPDYMVPSAFVVLPALPLTPNGKIDRRALAALERDGGSAEQAAPRSALEEVLHAIWCDVFARERIGVHERFGDLGGHSLLAIQIVARARDAFQVQVPLRAIFEAPTIASLAERVAALRAEGDRLVAPPIEPAPRDRPLPLSFTQERLWFLDRLEPGSSTYNVFTATRLAGPLDQGALARAISEIVRRHEVLRTTFAVQGGAPVQVIHDDMDVRLAVEDVTEASLGEAVAAETRRPFDLERGPLLRARLLRLSSTDHVLVLAGHHIVSDAQTQGVLARELGALYDAFADGRPSPLAPLPIQYADYAVWQRSWLAGEVLDRELGYWRAALAGAPSSLDLPTDLPRPAVQTYRGARASVSLPAEVRDALAALSRRRGATMFMTILAAYAVLLRRWSGQDDIVVGTPAMNRTRAETEGLVGCFLNTLVIRARLEGAATFAEVLGRVRDASLGAYAHQDLPFERLVHELAPERDLSRSPVFQVSFTLQSVGGEERAPGGLRRRGVAAPIDTSKFDLTLFAIEGPRGLSLVFEYATDLFAVATVERLGAELATLLEGITRADDGPLDALPLLPPAELEKLTTAFHPAASEYPREATLPGLVAAQAARSPDAVAVVFDADALTYRELDLRSNRLARHLRARGVAPGALVGIALERSAAMVVALLAVHKAGAAYVPLDPTYPRDRLAFMAEDAGLSLLVTETRLEGVVPAPAGGTLVLDAAAEAIAAEDDGPLDPGVGAEALAYVIYTSGSTGKPKGVEIQHRALVNFLTTMAREPGLGADDRLLAVTSLSFDIAGLEIWLPLTVGARVVVASRVTAADGAALARRLLDDGITVMQATPSTFRLLLEAGWAGDGALKILVGGEAVPRDLVEQLVARAGSVWNMYGPTETTIWSCVQRLRQGEPVLIGRPIANTRVFVVHPQGGLAPIGVPGELYIGGDGLARGYLGRPELTAERFVTASFAGAPERLYRTGDLVRFREDGALEFLGRLDFQVKIRGFRIELGEIEAVLAEAPGVRRAVVAARDQKGGDKRLVAYVVPSDPAAPPALDELRAALRARLPEYMVPSAFVALDALPLTPAGKVDRRALPEPNADVAIEACGLVLPRDEDEARLAAIWRDVLGLSRVGVTDSFFDLGGHSMLAVKMMAEVERVFGRKLPLVSLFEAQTVEALARLLRRDAGDDWPSLVAVRPTGSRRPLFLVARPNVNILGYIALIKHIDPEQPVYGLQLRYPEESALGRPYSLEERESWAQRYLELMKGVQPEGPYLIAGMCEGALIAFAMVRRLEERGEGVGFFGVFDTYPEENTSVPWLHRVFVYDRTVRTAWAEGPDELYRYLRSRVGRVARTLLSRLRPKAAVRGPGVRPLRTVRSLWDERMWPGPGFVPPRIQTRIDLFRIRKTDYWRIDDPEFGWGSRTDGGVDIHLIDGDHGTFMRPEHIPLLGRQLREALEHAEEDLAAEVSDRARRAVALDPPAPPRTSFHEPAASG